MRLGRAAKLLTQPRSVTVGLLVAYAEWNRDTRPSVVCIDHQSGLLVQENVLGDYNAPFGVFRDRAGSIDYQLRIG